jgi:hypothetical protein
MVGMPLQRARLTAVTQMVDADERVVKDDLAPGRRLVCRQGWPVGRVDSVLWINY